MLVVVIQVVGVIVVGGGVDSAGGIVKIPSGFQFFSKQSSEMHHYDAVLFVRFGSVRTRV